MPFCPFQVSKLLFLITLSLDDIFNLMIGCMDIYVVKPGIIIRNLLRSLIFCNSGTCLPTGEAGSNFDAHHNDTMPLRRNPVRAPVSHQLRLLATKSNDNFGLKNLLNCMM